MAKSNTRLELTWIGKENRPKLEPRILVEDPEKSYHARFRRGDLTADGADERRSDSEHPRKSATSAVNSPLLTNIRDAAVGERLGEIDTRNGKRRELFDAQDAIDTQREDLIGKIEKQLKHTSAIPTLFAIRWFIL